MRTAKGSNGRRVVARRRNRLQVKGLLYRSATIDVLPDDVLLEVFNFYLDGDHELNALRLLTPVTAWHKLVHVCRRWRQVVFASPRQLNLRLLCTSRTPTKTLLDIWPELPIVIEDYGTEVGPRGIPNINAALEHNDRVREIAINSVPSPLLKIFTLIEVPFPALADLCLSSEDEHAPVLPNSFLDRSAPRLRTLKLNGIPFPGLPKLLLSAHHLNYLSLANIPDSGLISPVAMVTCLSSLTSLKSLLLSFRSPRSRLYQTNRQPPPLTRTVLPSLTSLLFNGVSEYLEDIVARIDFPLLNDINILFFNQLIFDTPLLRSFISRTEEFKAFHQASILFSSNDVSVALRREGWTDNGVLQLGISCKPSDWQLSSLAQICNSSLPPLPTLEHLYICEYGLHWQDGIEDTQWLELFHPFIGVKSLYLDNKFAPRVAPVLQELSGERVTEVLPALQNVSVQGPVQRAIARFITTRSLLGHPVVVQDWDGKWWE